MFRKLFCVPRESSSSASPLAPRRFALGHWVSCFGLNQAHFFFFDFAFRVLIFRLVVAGKGFGSSCASGNSKKSLIYFFSTLSPHPAELRHVLDDESWVERILPPSAMTHTQQRRRQWREASFKVNLFKPIRWKWMGIQRRLHSSRNDITPRRSVLCSSWYHNLLLLNNYRCTKLLTLSFSTQLNNSYRYKSPRISACTFRNIYNILQNSPPARWRRWRKAHSYC